ncbi:hypothetical protein F506_15700 [Herbaspirillum hiltneri N3]|uniref:MgtC-like C-terminal domain-containing protein n=1 Tax=Herbaspirillum hiltneri N3 TaxID=1262470 RepID=A0ABM5V2X9_9BURK|nr:hypothetical protein [Herbaspirillum hiltneri]AKZ63912.1 hypothetical protein F506_15700 [Herbaspirillum hiltneri N3]
MRIVKPETKLDSFFNGNYFMNGNAMPERLPYQVVTSCRCDEAPLIGELILLQLQEGFDQGYELEIKTRAHQPLIDFTVSLACSTPERASLVRLVSRLGLEKSVRSVRWQSVPAGDRQEG